MATMWPRSLPHEVMSNELRSAERRVYERLEAQLGKDWVVFYSRPWLGLTSTGEEIDGEADFVIASPHSGFLSLEVKGGAISQDPASGNWLSRDRYGIRHRIKNPVEQARSSKHALLKKLREMSGMENHYVRVRHAVLFPDSANPGRPLGADMPLDLFCFREDFDGRLGTWIERRLGTPEGREQPLGVRGIRALEDLLARPFQLHVPLAQFVQDDEISLAMLTPTQFRILNAIESVPRAAVSGGAGTGKTILAIEKARLSVESGRRTLLTCYNKPLAAYLAARTCGLGGLSVETFQAACRGIIKASGLAIPPNPDSYPDHVSEAVRICPDLRYDSIIVDEGQDILPHWWVAIDDLLKPVDAQLYVFLDSNQRVYSDVGGLRHDIQLIPIRLSENLRNTKKIHEVCQYHYSGPSMLAIGPEGQKVDWITCDANMISKTVEATITRFMKEKIAPGDIAVLAPSSPWPANTYLAGQRTVGCDAIDDRSIICDTVRRFKGLERAVVIVIADEKLVADIELTYVALSRARTLLCVVGEETCLARLRS